MFHVRSRFNPQQKARSLKAASWVREFLIDWFMFSAGAAGIAAAAGAGAVEVVTEAEPLFST